MIKFDVYCPECGYKCTNMTNVCPSCGFDYYAYKKELIRKEAEKKEAEESKNNEKEQKKLYLRNKNKIYFGNYYFNNAADQYPIEWDILEEKDGKAFIISHYILDSKTFDDKGSNNYETSYIRKWLNETFYNIAFNDVEKGIFDNIEDKIFLLSIKEYDDYHTFDNVKHAESTNYAEEQGLLMHNKSACWWLRSASDKSIEHVYGINNEGVIDIFNVNHNDYGIRPACWIKL